MDYKKTKQNFKVLRGGLNVPPNVVEQNFIDGYVTDTRYMGVVGLYMHYQVAYRSAPDDITELHQFFYFETEEYGLEEYSSIKGDDPESLVKLEANLFGGLGGKNIPVTEKEGLYLLQTFVDFNRTHNLPLPDEKEEYIFYLNNPVETTAHERAVIQSKICTEIENNYQAIHYFLMRVFGKDFTGASYLVKGNVLLNQFETMPILALCMNTLDIHSSGEVVTYMAESVVEDEGDYTILVSEVTVNSDHQIVDFSSRSSLRITPKEAAMKLRKSEYVTIYDYKGSVAKFGDFCKEIVNNSITTEMDYGELYMCFRKDNDHVKKRIFRLSDDVESICYVNENGQLLAAAYTLPDILKLEKHLEASRIGVFIKPSAKYEFKEPLMIEFMTSGISDFNEFLELIRQDRE